MDVQQSSAALGTPDRPRKALSYVGAVSLVLAAFILFQILWPLRWNLVAFWVAVEVIFYIFYWRPRYAELNAQPGQHRPASEDAMAAFNRVIQYFRESTMAIDYDMYYSGWFLGAKFEDIKKGNAEEFLAYAFWYRTMQQMQDEGLGHFPAQMRMKLEEVWGLELKPGYTPGLQFMGHLWEPLKAQWRPLAFYAGTEAVGWFARHMLRRWGFQQGSHEAMAYFTLNMTQPCQALTSPFKLPALKQDNGSATLTDCSMVSTATSPATPPPSVSTTPPARTSSSPPAAVNKPMSAPSLPALFAQSAVVPEASSLSSQDLSTLLPLRSKSCSPFQAQGLNWAARLAADADNLTASIQVASAVHTTDQALAAPTAVPVARVGSGSANSANTTLSLRRRLALNSNSSSSSPRAQQQQQVSTPRLSTHTSLVLRNSPNPLEEALSEDLANKDMPVLFLHGVGGLPAYLEMLLQVMALGHPVIVVQCSGVAMRLGPVCTADEVVDQVVGVLDKLGVEQACVIGHSYGTFVAGRLARLHRERVRSLCLIDPVCFGMFMPQLLNNFLYATPQWKGLHHFVDYVKKAGVYMASHELHVCATFSRGFFWSDLNLWPEDCAPGSVVLLSGRDDLMNAQQVKEMLEQSGHIKVHYNRDLTHGEFLIKSEVKAAIMEEMRTMLARSGSAVVGLARPVLQTTVTLACNALGVSSSVRIHQAGGGAKYVEDHTNKLVRTFTGNLTAMLHQVQSIRPTFDTVHTPTNSSNGNSSRSRLSRVAAAADSSDLSSGSSAASSIRSFTAGAAAASGAAGGAAAPSRPVMTPGFLPGAMSLPIKHKFAAREHWSKKIEEIAEQPSTGMESSGSNGGEQLLQQQQSQLGSEGSAADAGAVGAVAAEKQQQDEASEGCVADQVEGGLKGALAARVARRSSGSGGSKVLVMSDGVEVSAGCVSPVCKIAEQQQEQCRTDT